MEPNILLVGRNLEVMEILKNELSKFDRNVVAANSNELIERRLTEDDINIVVVGAGLPDETRKSMGDLIKKLKPEIEVHMIERSADGSPAKMIDFTNEKAVMWKIGKVLGPMRKPKGN